MKLHIVTPDPLHVFESTKPIVENAKYVSLNEDAIPRISEKIRIEIENYAPTLESEYGSTGNLEKDVQLIFLEDVVNFCFWPDQGESRWTVEWPKGKFTSGGWYSLQACFKRALLENELIIDAKYLVELGEDRAKYFFRGADEIEIPLLEERIKNLQEAGRVLLEKYKGQFINVIEASDFDATRLVELVYKDFTSFADISYFDGREIFFLKRAQILANDISYAANALKNLELLTAFADYKLPQIFRHFSLFNYSEELAGKIDSYIILPHDSREEIEIRAATIWAVELIQQVMGSISAAQIDNSLWRLSQELYGAKPYHRTRTIYY